MRSMTRDEIERLWDRVCIWGALVGVAAATGIAGYVVYRSVAAKRHACPLCLTEHIIEERGAE